MGKQKVVMKVSMKDAKKRSKALKIVVGLPGVLSVALEGVEKDRIVVVGDGVDSIALTIMLRRKIGYVELVSVTSLDERKEEKKESKPMSVQPTIWPYYASVQPPYQCVNHEVNYDPSCYIM